MRCLRFLSFLAAVGVLVHPSISTGQSTQIAPRITTPVNESSLVTLTGNVSSRARAEFDTGAASPSTQLSHVRLMLSRSSAQEAALNKYLAELQDKSSPNYHKWLTPAQFGKLYGPADSDIAAIVRWLQSQGLRVDGVSSGRTNIAFSGSVAQIERAFHTSIHSYQVLGEQFFSNNSNPKIPAALAGVVSGVARLNTIRPRPQHVANRLGKYDPATHRLKAAQPFQARRPRAQLTTGSGSISDPYQLFMVPGDAATIYDTPNSLNAGFTTGTSYNGTGVTIGVGGDAVIQATTVASYRNRFLGDSNQPIITNVDNTTATADTDEAYIDTELAGGLAPGATIHFYTASTLDIAIEQMLADNSVDIFSLSFGECELQLTTAENALINGWWQQAATQGIAVSVATGDNGSAGCDNNSTEDAATNGLAVSGYASTPYNIAVGGTDLIGLLDQTKFTTYASDPSANSGTNLYRTALQYIPESTWNDSTATDGVLDSNVPFTDPTSGANNINAGSGGASTCSTNTSTDAAVGTCTNGYPKPAWQTGIGVPADALRDMPDVSLMSGAGGDNASWLVCTDDVGPNSATPPVNVTADCTDQSDKQFYFFGFGGTSTAAPAFAGILAMVQQHSGGRLGQAAKQLYDIYNGPAAASIFNDITVGNNSVVCASGSTNCAMNTAGNFFLTGFDTTVGYDLATGLGSVDVSQLVAYWGTATGDSPVTVTVTPAAASVDTIHSLGVSVSVTDPSNLSIPNGNVSISGGGYVSPLPATLVDGSGNASLTIPAGALKAGTVTLTVIYNGDTTDGTFSVGTGKSPQITVTKVASSLTVTPASTTIAPSASLVVTGAVSGAGPKPTGTVTLTSGSYTSAATTLSSGSYSITIPANTLALGNNSLTVNYSGDNIYNTSTGNGSVTVPGFMLAATPLSFSAGATTGNASTLTVTPVAGYAGTVTFTATVTSAPAGAVSSPTFTISPSTLTFASGTATPQTSQVTVATTPIPSYVRKAGNSGIAWFKAAGGTTILGLLFFFLPLGTRRGRKILSLVALVFAATFTIAGCGSVHTSGGGGGGKTTPSVTVSPAKGVIATTDTLSVAVSVSGGTSTATGTVTLSSGSYKSAATNLASGAATIVVPASTLAVGTQTLTASYSGDSNFNSASGTGSVKVGAPATTAGNYTVTVTAVGSDAGATTVPTTFTLTVN
ncbi:MAG TPA: protease pro-enzyme activation domain-containing protein [Terracidiphilus sp.]